MTTIGLIGSGNIGGTVAWLAVAAGYDVVVSNSRGPETLADLVAELGPRARAATATEAAEAADLAVVTIPLKAYEAVPVAPLAGKVVIDTNNYYPERDGRIAALDEKRTTTSQLLQEHLPESHVVKAFNNIYFEHLLAMARPAGASDRNTLLVAGDDEAAKATVREFLDAIGYDSLDTGSLADSWRQENGQPGYAGAYAEGGDFSKPRVASPEHLRELLAQGTR
jgi:predicted dinucleotide-binding enzyme